MESNSKLYLLVLYIGFLAPFLLRGLTWAMLYVWTKNYPQVVGTCSGHHGQLISQNCVLTKIRAEPPPLIDTDVYGLKICYFTEWQEVKIIPSDNVKIYNLFSLLLSASVNIRYSLGC